MENVIVFDHPLIQHKISILRKKSTGTNEFRALIEEIAMLMGYEALRDLPLEDVEVETPIETCMTPMIAGRKLAVVPILRAGLGMVNGILALVPSAKVRRHMNHMNITANFRIRSRNVPLLLLTQCWQPVDLLLQLLISSSSTVERRSNLWPSSQHRKVLRNCRKHIRTFRFMLDI